MNALALFILAAIVASPGPLDRNGGHLDPVTGQYHFHAGPSIQFRYVDGAGRIWEGNGPRPDENLHQDADNIIWHTPLVPTIVIATLLLLGFVLFFDYRFKRWRYRRHRHHHHHHARRIST